MLEGTELGIPFLGTAAGALLSLGFSLSMIVVLAACGCCKCCVRKVKMPTEEEDDDSYKAVVGGAPASGSKSTSEVVINMGVLGDQGQKNTTGDPMSSRPLLSSSYNRALPSLPSSKPPTTVYPPEGHPHAQSANSRSEIERGSLTRESSASDLYASVDKFAGSKNKHVYAKIRDKQSNQGELGTAAFGSGVAYSAIDDDEESESGDALYSKINSTKPLHSSSATIRLAPLSAPNNERVYEYPTFQGAMSKLPRHREGYNEQIYGGESSEDPYSSIKSDSESGGLARKGFPKPEEPLYEGVGPSSAVSDETGAGHDPRYAMIHRSALESQTLATRQTPTSRRRTTELDGPDTVSIANADDDAAIDQLYAKIRRRHSCVDEASTSVLQPGARDPTRASAGPGYPMVPEKRFDRTEYLTNTSDRPNDLRRETASGSGRNLIVRDSEEAYSASGSLARGGESTASGEPPYKYITVREPLEALRARIENGQQSPNHGDSDVNHARLPSENSAHYYSSISEHSYETVPGRRVEQNYERRGPHYSDSPGRISPASSRFTNSERSPPSVPPSSGERKTHDSSLNSNVSTVRISFAGDNSSSDQILKGTNPERPNTLLARMRGSFDASPSQNIPDPPTSPIPPPLSKGSWSASHQRIGSAHSHDGRNVVSNEAGQSAVLPNQVMVDPTTAQNIDREERSIPSGTDSRKASTRLYDSDSTLVQSVDELKIRSTSEYTSNTNQRNVHTRDSFEQASTEESRNIISEHNFAVSGDIGSTHHRYASSTSSQSAETNPRFHEADPRKKPSLKEATNENRAEVSRFPFQRQESVEQSEYGHTEPSGTSSFGRRLSEAHKNGDSRDPKSASQGPSPNNAMSAETRRNSQSLTSDKLHRPTELDSRLGQPHRGDPHANDPVLGIDTHRRLDHKKSVTHSESNKNSHLQRGMHVTSTSFETESSQRRSANFNPIYVDAQSQNRKNDGNPTGDNWNSPPRNEQPNETQLSKSFSRNSSFEESGHERRTSLKQIYSQESSSTADSDGIVSEHHREFRPAARDMESFAGSRLEAISSTSSPSKIPRAVLDKRPASPQIRNAQGSSDSTPLSGVDYQSSYDSNRSFEAVRNERGIAKLVVNTSSDQLASPKERSGSLNNQPNASDPRKTDRPLEISIPNLKDSSSSPSRFSASRSRSHSRDKLRIAKTSTLPKSSPKSPSKEDAGRWGIYRGPPIGPPMSPQSQSGVHSPRGLSSPGVGRGEGRNGDSAKPRSASATTTPFDQTLGRDERMPSKPSKPQASSTSASSAGSSPEKKSVKSSGSSSSKSPSKDGATIRSPGKEPPPASGHDIHVKPDKPGGKGDGHTHHVNCFCHSRRPDPIAIVKENISTIEKSGARNGSQERAIGGTNKRNRNSSSIFRL